MSVTRDFTGSVKTVRRLGGHEILKEERDVSKWNIIRISA